MDTIIYTLIVVIIIIYAFKAFNNYKPYKESILPIIFPNYMEFFWRTVIRKDASTSSFLQKQIGVHKLSFTTIKDTSHNITSRFVLLFSHKGITLIEYIDETGKYYGNEKDRYWRIKKEKRTIKIANPIHELKKYQKRIEQILPNVTISSIIAITNKGKLTNISTKEIICFYNQLLDHLQMIQSTQIFTEDGVLDLFSNYLKNKT